MPETWQIAAATPTCPHDLAWFLPWALACQQLQCHRPECERGGVSSGQLGALHTAASSAKGPMADQLHRETHAPGIGFVSSTFDAGAGYGTPAFAFSTRPLPHGGALSRVVHWIHKHPLATSRSLHTSTCPLVYLRPSGSSGCHIGLDVLFIVAPHRRLLYDTNRHMPC